MVIEGMGHDLPPALMPRMLDAIASHCRAAEAQTERRAAA
jgi:hypothetical protein